MYNMGHTINVKIYTQFHKIFGIGSCLGTRKSPITNEIVKMGTLNCFEELILN
jgi:hypothetical protein